MPPSCAERLDCANCGRAFYQRKSDSAAQKAARKYCSKACSNRANAVRTPVEERFWRFAVKTHSGCWKWTGGTDGRGYGSISEGGAGSPNLKAHRVSWALHVGPIPPGLEVLHLCDNPACCNPDHLAVGTHAANMFDAGQKRRIGLHPNSLANLNTGSRK